MNLLQKVETSQRKYTNKEPIIATISIRQQTIRGKEMQIQLGKNTVMPITWQQNITYR